MPLSLSLSLSLSLCVCVCVCGCAAQVQPAAQRSGRTRRAGSTPRRHPYIGAGELPGRLASQSKVVRASYLPAGRVPAVYLMVPQAPPQQAHGSNGCQLGTATTKPTSDKAAASWCMDTLGIEPRASRMLSGCDTTTPRALCETEIQLRVCAQKHSAQRSSGLLAEWHVGAADAAGSLSRVDHPAQLKCRQPRNAAVAQGEPAAPHGAIHI